MTITSRTRRALAAAAAVALAATLLSGCSLLPHPEGVTIPGVGSVGAGTMPSDWPAAVPVAQGDVLFGAAAGSAKSAHGRVWNITIKVSGADAYGRIRDQLTGTGFTVGAEPDAGDAAGGAGTFVKGPDSVLVVVTKGDTKTGWVANYTVTQTQGSD